MRKSDPLLLAVQEILFQSWDPIGVNSDEACRSEYDSYAPAIYRMLEEGVDEFKLASHLSQLRRVSMGMSAGNEEHHQDIARQLLKLKT